MTNKEFTEGIARYEAAAAAATAADATASALSREALSLLAPLAAEVAARHQQACR